MDQTNAGENANTNVTPVANGNPCRSHTQAKQTVTLSVTNSRESSLNVIQASAPSPIAPASSTG